MKYEASILKRLIDTYGVIGNPRYLSEIIKEFIVRGKELYPQLFTYQADWLAHIDEYGLTPEYVVSYTGQQIYAPHTKERPVKRAILKGQTLVNLQHMTSIAYQSSNDGIIAKENNRIICTSKSTVGTNIRFYYVADASKTYTVKCKLFNNSSSDIKFLDHTTNYNNPIAIATSGETSSINFKFKPHNNSVNMGVLLFINHSLPRVKDEEVVIEDLIILEGDYTNVDIPYFEGMQSVRMPVLTTTGKNLFDGVLFDGKPTDIKPNMHYKNTGFIEVKSNESYVIQSDGKMDGVYFFNENKEVISTTNTPYTTKNIITPEKCKYISVQLFQRNEVKIQIEEGTQATEYEPYKSNILTVNEDVTLRSNGSVCDELDLLTSKLTQRIDEDGEILTQEVVKTVDLTIHDKVHQKVERLTTFEGGTHFTTSSQDGSLLPTLTVDVVTDLEETLMVCSLEGNTM